MKLLTKQMKKSIPPIYAQDGNENPTVHAKFFTPWSHWTWYVTEFDGEDQCFGLVSGHEDELGYFSLNELENLKGPFGLKVERDLYFKPTDLKSIQQKG